MLDCCLNGICQSLPGCGEVGRHEIEVLDRYGFDQIFSAAAHDCVRPRPSHYAGPPSHIVIVRNGQSQNCVVEFGHIACARELGRSSDDLSIIRAQALSDEGQQYR